MGVRAIFKSGAHAETDSDESEEQETGQAEEWSGV